MWLLSSFHLFVIVNSFCLDPSLIDLCNETQSPSNIINLPDYSIEHRPTEATAVGSLLYFNKKTFL